MANGSSEQKSLEVTFDFLRLSIADMEEFLSTPADDSIVGTATAIYKTLVDYPKKWGELNSADDLIDKTQYWEWKYLKEEFSELLTTIRLVDIDSLVEWDIFAPSTKDVMAYDQLMKAQKYEEGVIKLAPFLKKYPATWGDLKTVDSIREHMPYWASRLLGRSLNNAIVAHQKK